MVHRRHGGGALWHFVATPTRRYVLPLALFLCQPRWGPAEQMPTVTARRWLEGYPLD